MKSLVISLLLAASTLVPGGLGAAFAEHAPVRSSVASAALGANPDTDIAAFRAAALADHDARLAEARAAAAAEAAAVQAAAEAAAAEAVAAAAAADVVGSWSSSEEEASESNAGAVVEAAPAAAASAAAEPVPTSPRPDNSNCGPCPGATLEWIVYEGVGYWACP